MARLTKAQQARLLERDARNRALRTFLQGLALDVLVAVCLVVYDAVQTEHPDYRLLLATVIKTGMATAASYVMRRFMDRSKVPTPLPPGDPGEPDNDAGEGEWRLIGVLALGITSGLILYQLLSQHTSWF